MFRKKERVVVVAAGEKETGEKAPRKKKEPRKRRMREVKENTHRLRVLVLWMLLLASFAFAVYKNFTAIDVRHEVVRQTVKEKVVDTNAVESFARNFIHDYYAWKNTREGLEKWQQSLSQYMTEDLQKLNMSAMPSGISTSSQVDSAEIWDVEREGQGNYKVVYSVGQTIISDGGKEDVSGAYYIRVHADKEGNMVIVENPSVSSIPKVSDYKPKEPVSDGELSGKQEEINTFLDTFFKLYPTATQTELEFYVADGALPAVDMGRYQYNKLEQAVLMDGKGGTVDAAVTVSYLDTATKVMQYNQFELVLKKGDNWKIVGEGFDK